MAISGRGFCPVADRLNPGPGDFMLTRAGSFRPNEDGYLVNAAGHFLQGWPIGQDGTVGIVGRDDFSSLSAVRVAAVPLSGNPTADVTFTGNLPSQQRSEEHTSELQSLMRTSYAVFCLKKKKTTPTT